MNIKKRIRSNDLEVLYKEDCAKAFLKLQQKKICDEVPFNEIADSRLGKLLKMKTPRSI